MKSRKVSEHTTNRLSVYLRCLREFSAQGTATVSSSELAARAQVNPAQIRKDLANFGEFGVRGVGYFVEGLKSHLIKILGLEKTYNLAIIGAGRLGTALADYYGLVGSNFSVVALFDSDLSKVGGKVGGFDVFAFQDFASVAEKCKIEVAVIAVPGSKAQEVLDKVTQAGVRAVMNFAPVPLKAKRGVKLKTIDLTVSLESLSYFLSEKGTGDAVADEGGIGRGA